AVSPMPGCRSRRFSSVVFPLPRKPVISEPPIGSFGIDARGSVSLTAAILAQGCSRANPDPKIIRMRRHAIALFLGALLVLAPLTAGADPLRMRIGWAQAPG